MIVCYINNLPAYPSTSSSIKVTFENAAIKDRESRTQELTFNLDITENRKVFGAVNRIDVKKSATTFATCRLYADNLLVIEGEGTITSYSDTEVKLQIKTATAASQFPDSFSAKYIDVIADYLTTDQQTLEKQLVDNDGNIIETTAGSIELIVIHDEANDRWLNTPIVHYDSESREIGHYAPQPFLKDVVARVVYALGYYESEQYVASALSPIAFFEQHPWNKLRVLNTNTSLRYRNILPHWTVEKFFTELSNLFNIRFAFNEKTKRVSVTENQKVSSEERHYDCLDEFSSDYDEDGETLLASSNLEYNIGESDEWDTQTLSQEIMAQFPLIDYTSVAAFEQAFALMSDQEKLTNIFRTPKYLAYARHKTDDDGNATSEIEAVEVPLGNLVRQPESEEAFALNIVPACLTNTEVEIKSRYSMALGGTGEITSNPTMPALSTKESKAMITNGTEGYVTVEDVVDDTDSDKTDEQERMEIYFVFGTKSETFKYIQGDTTINRSFNFSNLFTYDGSNPNYSRDFSLSLCDTKIAYSIANFHSQTSRVENHETLVIKFEADDLPDPRKTYVFRHKRFLCDKIELEITSEGISKIKTGYFFEMQ